MSNRKSLSWLGTAQIASFVLQFGFSVILARYLTPFEMGIYAVAAAVVGVLSIFQQVSLPALIVREEEITEDFTRTAFTVNAVLTLLLSLAIAGASFVGAAALRAPGVKDVLLVLAVTPLLGIVSFLPMANMEREGRFKELALITTAANVFSTAVGVTLVVSGFGYMSIAYAQLANTATMTLLGVYAGRHHARYRMGLRSWRRVLEFSVQMLAIAGIHGISQRFAELLIGRMLGLSALGLYNRAAGLNNMLWYNINVVVARVVLVDFSEIHRRGHSLRERYLQTVAVVTAVLWPVFAGFAIIAKPFVALVYGERWTPAVGPFVFLALASILLSSIAMTWELFTTTGRLREQTRLEIIRAAMGFALFALGCTIGLEAAAASRMLEAVFAIWLYRPYLNRMTDTVGRDFIRIYFQSGLLTLFAVAPAAALMLVERDANPSVPLLAGAIVLGIAAWIAGLALIDHPLLREIRLIAAAMRRVRPPQVPIS